MRRWNVSLNLGSADPKGALYLPSSETHVSFSVSNFKYITTNIDYCLMGKMAKAESPEKYFAVGVRGNLTTFDLHTKLEDWNTGGHFPDVHTFDTHEFKNAMCRFEVSLPISYYRRREKLWLIHRLGATYSGFFNKKITCRYKEEVTHSNPQQDSLGNWTWITITTGFQERETDLNFNGGFSGFYSLSVGYKVKNVIISLSGEANVFNNFISFGNAKYKTGIILKYGAGLT